MKITLKDYYHQIILALVFSSSLFLTFVIRQVIYDFPIMFGEHPLLDVWLRIILILFIVSIVSTLKWIRNESLKLAIVVGLLSIFFATIVLFTLKNTPYALNGVGSDQSFRTAYITKFGHFTNFVDFTYKDLPSFYPPLYYYVLGRIASILGLAPYVMSKFGLIATVFILPFLTYILWSLVVGRSKAGVIAFVILFFQWWYKPSGWICIFMFVPWWLYFIEGISVHLAEEKRWKGWRFIFGGLLGSVIFQTYYFLFFIGFVGLFMDYFLKKFILVHEKSFDWKLIQDKILMLVSTAIFSAYYWFPFISSMYLTGGWEQMQTRDFSLGNATLSLPFFTISVTGFLLLVGVIYLLITFRSDRLSFSMFNLVISAYLLVVFGFIGVIIGEPIKANVAMKVTVYILYVSALLAFIKLWENKLWGKINKEYGKLLVQSMLILTLVFVGQEVVEGLALDERVDVANKTDFPEKLITAFLDMSDNDFAGSVLLADGSYQEIAVYLPVFEFITWHAHYSHPAGLFDDRAEFLSELSNIESPSLFAALLMNNRYSRIDYIMLVPKEDGYRLKFSVDAFPYGTKTELIHFNHTLFDEKYFIRKEKYGFVMFIPIYENDPVDELQKLLSDWQIIDESIDVDDINRVFQNFEEHLQLD